MSKEILARFISKCEKSANDDCTKCDGKGYLVRAHENPVADNDIDSCDECERLNYEYWQSKKPQPYDYGKDARSWEK
jgi:hypothetical protein